MTINRRDLTKYLNKLLNTYDFDDYGPNGLQVEGADEINKIAFAVSATRESIEEAVNWSADALIVHHGLFWKFHGPKKIIGSFAARVKPLIKNDINLFGYHLPLDAHPEIGNAASLANRIGLINQKPFGLSQKTSIGISGEFKKALSAKDLKAQLEIILGGPVKLSSHDDDEEIQNLGIVTGGANKYWRDCLKGNIDAFLTGEMSEHDYHEAKEDFVHYFAGGHHNTEKFGVQDLMEHLRNEFSIDGKFFDCDNPA